VWLGVGACAATQATAAGAPSTLTVNYLSVDTFQATLANGSVIGPGTVIPAGTYQIIVNDDNYIDPLIDLAITGPGIDLLVDLDGGSDTTAAYDETLAPSSSYSFQDDMIGASTRVTFSTSAVNSASVTAGANAQGTGKGQANSNITANGSTNLGTIDAAVSAAGKVTLSFQGSAVTALAAGLYTFTVADHSKTAGLVLEDGTAPALTLTSAAYEGTRSEAVNLRAGRWSYASSVAGVKRYISVQG
jgi:hypothetical protein